jgi:hypothetical protein
MMTYCTDNTSVIPLVQRTKRHSRITETDSPIAITRDEDVLHPGVILNARNLGTKLERPLRSSHTHVCPAVV